MAQTADDNQPQGRAGDLQLLGQTEQFLKLPEQVRNWITDSPLATQQFAQFFRDGGKIQPQTGEPLAAYRERTPPEIALNPTYYPLVNLGGRSTEYQEARLFAMLAHEIGHHSINSQTHPFQGTTREQNVLYRAEHEAKTVLNAFRIFDELRDKDPAYRPRYDSVGYGSDLQIAAIYQEWRQSHDEAATIRSLASIVLATPDSRTTQGLDSVPDYNRDGNVTNAERFQRDWDRSEELKRNGPRSKDSSAPDSPQTSPAGQDESSRAPKQTNENNSYLSGIREKAEQSFLLAGIPIAPGELDCVSVCLAGRALQSGLSRVDHVVLSQHRSGEVGQNVFAVEGRLDDPAHRRAHVNTQEAISTPLTDATRQLEAATAQHSVDASERAPTPSQTQGPTR
jgi:hypothetical protein